MDENTGRDYGDETAHWPRDFTNKLKPGPIEAKMVAPAETQADFQRRIEAEVRNATNRPILGGGGSLQGIGQARAWPLVQQPLPDPTAKPSNPKDAIGSDKIPHHLWPAVATILGTLGLTDGMLKYGRANWREAQVRFSIYYDALKRHLDALNEGEWDDPDSGLPHLSHILASAAIIADAHASGDLIDDRMYKGGFYRKFIDTMTKHVARLKLKHADKSPKHWTIKDNK